MKCKLYMTKQDITTKHFKASSDWYFYYVCSICTELEIQLNISLTQTTELGTTQLILNIPYCQAQPQLYSTQPQLKLRLRLALFPADPPTRPPVTVVKTTVTGGLRLF